MLNNIKTAIPQKKNSLKQYFNSLTHTYYLKLAIFAMNINLRYPNYNNLKE